MNTKKIIEQFDMVAREYDANRRLYIPCFDDYYAATTEFIASGIEAPSRILDLGAGTGLLSLYWYKAFPEAEFVLADVAEGMLEVAKKRFSGLASFSFVATDYTDSLPEGKFDCIISALSIHHLEDADKIKLFARIKDSLTPDGIFVNYDQFCGNTAALTEWMDRFCIGNLEKSGLSESELQRWRERRKLDRECSVEDEVQMLRSCGFNEVQCVFSNQKFSVIEGR